VGSQSVWNISTSRNHLCPLSLTYEAGCIGPTSVCRSRNASPSAVGETVELRAIPQTKIRSFGLVSLTISEQPGEIECLCSHYKSPDEKTYPAKQPLQTMPIWIHRQRRGGERLLPTKLEKAWPVEIETAEVRPNDMGPEIASNKDRQITETSQK